MKNIWVLLTKYNALFLFLLFFGISFLFVVTNNDFQRASTWNSSHALIGSVYDQTSRWTNYLKLADANQELLNENARLRRQLYLLESRDTSRLQTVTDTAGIPQYTYLSARVINNSIRQKNNYITIDKGSRQGIEKGMGVIGPNGVVGIVLNVSPNFATIQSILHGDSRISAALVTSHAFGSLVWGGHYDPKKALLKDIPNHIEVNAGEKVVTSGYSLFPPGIRVGTVLESAVASGESFLELTIELSTDFHNLQYVYVVMANFTEELDKLQSETIAPAQ